MAAQHVTGSQDKRQSHSVPPPPQQTLARVRTLSGPAMPWEKTSPPVGVERENRRPARA